MIYFNFLLIQTKRIIYKQFNLCILTICLKCIVFRYVIWWLNIYMAVGIKSKCIRDPQSARKCMGISTIEAIKLRRVINYFQPTPTLSNVAVDRLILCGWWNITMLPALNVYVRCECLCLLIYVDRECNLYIAIRCWFMNGGAVVRVG